MFLALELFGTSPKWRPAAAHAPPLNRSSTASAHTSGQPTSVERPLAATRPTALARWRAAALDTVRARKKTMRAAPAVSSASPRTARTPPRRRPAPPPRAIGTWRRPSPRAAGTRTRAPRAPPSSRAAGTRTRTRRVRAEGFVWRRGRGGGGIRGTELVCLAFRPPLSPVRAPEVLALGALLPAPPLLPPPGKSTTRSSAAAFGERRERRGERDNACEGDGKRTRRRGGLVAACVPRCRGGCSLVRVLCVPVCRFVVDASAARGEERREGERPCALVRVPL